MAINLIAAWSDFISYYTLSKEGNVYVYNYSHCSSCSFPGQFSQILPKENHVQDLLTKQTT